MASHSPILLNPGPVAVPEHVLTAITQPVIHQRTAAFDRFFARFQENLQYVFQTKAPVVAMPGSGTFGVESAMWSLFQPGDKVAIPAMGKFSQRWVAFAMEIGLDVVPMGVAWGHGISVANVQEVLAEYPDLRGWVLTHVETSTGVAIDLEEISLAIKAAAPQQLVVVDAICSVGIQALYMDAWQLDVVVTASQKGLQNPAGTVYVAIGGQAAGVLAFPESADYRHLGHYYRYLQQGSYPFTPPIQLFYGVDAAAARMRELTLPKVWNDTHAMSRYLKGALSELGGEVYGLGNADALTVLSFGRTSHDAIRERLVFEHGVETAGGQDQLDDLVIRVGHFGPVGMAEMQRCVAGLRAIVKGGGQ